MLTEYPAESWAPRVRAHELKAPVPDLLQRTRRQSTTAVSKKHITNRCFPAPDAQEASKKRGDGGVQAGRIQCGC